MKKIITLLTLLSSLPSFANGLKPFAELEVTVNGFRNGDPTYMKRVIITPKNISRLNKKLGTSNTVGYMSELTSGKACYRGDAETVRDEILTSSDVIQYFGDEVCSDNGHLSKDGRVIVFSCKSPMEEGYYYDVKVAPCKKKINNIEQTDG